jgi:P27 family predicted phage terminase small subunit
LEETRRLANPGHRALPKPAKTFPVAALSLTPPRGLGAPGKKLWRHVAALPWVGASDAAALLLLCELADQAQALRDDLKAHGATYECRGRRYMHPAVAALHEATKQLTSGLSAFGLTPSDRSRLNLAERKPESTFELLQMRAKQIGQTPPAS